MQLANIMVALAGDKGNTVPKNRVTPAETAVLLTIHGEGAVFDIDILDEELERSARDTVADLRERYKARNEDGDVIVDLVYPGRTPQVHMTFADLELDESCYVATGRATPSAATAKTETDETETDATPAPEKPAAKKTGGKKDAGGSVLD